MFQAGGVKSKYVGGWWIGLDGCRRGRYEAEGGIISKDFEVRLSRDTFYLKYMCFVIDRKVKRYNTNIIKYYYHKY